MYLALQHRRQFISGSTEPALPTIDNLVVLASVLGVRIDDILEMAGAKVSMSA